MKKNMGSLDRKIRVALALVIAILYSSATITGTLALIALIIAGIFIINSFIGFCPLYAIFGITGRKEY